jgi:hypothetical protein
VILVRKKGGPDDGRLYAMKRIEKAVKIDAVVMGEYKHCNIQ